MFDVKVLFKLSVNLMYVLLLLFVSGCFVCRMKLILGESIFWTRTYMCVSS